MKAYVEIINSSGICAVDAKHLLAYVLNCSLSSATLYDTKNLTVHQYDKFLELVKMRKNGCPVDIITGRRSFWEGEFVNTKDTLSPRPDSEALIELVLQELENSNADATLLGDKQQGKFFLDLGTGSGCLAISLLMSNKYLTGLAIDISEKALEIAKINSQKNKVGARIEFLTSSWFSQVRGQFDFIISNPPYIKTSDINNLSQEVQNYDPNLALDGGCDGLNCYRVIAGEANKYLKKNGFIAVEFGESQDKEVDNIFSSFGFERKNTIKDLSGITRANLYKCKY